MQLSNLHNNISKEDAYKEICNGRGCQETSKVIVEESIGKFGAIKLYLCYSCAKKFQRCEYHESSI